MYLYLGSASEPPPPIIRAAVYMSTLKALFRSLARSHARTHARTHAHTVRYSGRERGKSAWKVLSCSLSLCTRKSTADMLEKGAFSRIVSAHWNLGGCGGVV